MKKISPKICFVSIGVLIHEGKILLVKHKKAQIWLCPGGHVEEDELPHAAAEREFWEETGVRVRVVSALPMPPQNSSADTEFVPAPFLTNFHWISRKNFTARTTDDETQNDPVWQRGCEKHFAFLYFVEPLGDLTYTQNTKENDAIAWYNREAATQLETTDDIRAELQLAFDIYEKNISHNQKSSGRGH